jgi:hypothetical protein
LLEWNEYLIARKSGVKKLWKPLLEERVCHFESLSGDDLKEYIYDICVEYFDNGCDDIPLQHPKIWEKVLVQWSDEILSNNEKYMLWAFKATCFKDVYKLVGLEPSQLLERILKSNSGHYQAKQLLVLHHVDTLDFALHELPTGLVVEESVCLNAINRCESLIAETPELVACKNRFGCDFNYYKKMYFSWGEYKEKGIQEDFFAWFTNKI